MKSEILNWFIEQINNTKDLVRSKKTKEKLVNYLNKINDFTEQNQTISKKELTQVENAFNKLCVTYYGLLKGNDLNGESKYNILDNLSQKRGFRNFFDAKESPVNLLSNLNVGLSSIKYNLKKIDGIEFNSFEQDFLDKYYPNMLNWLELYNTIEEIRSIHNPTKEEKIARKLKEIKGRVNQNLRKSIEKIGEDFRIKIEKDFLKYFENRIKYFNKKYPNGLPYNDESTIFTHNYLVNKGEKYNNVYVLIPNINEVVAKESYDRSVEIITSWELKMFDKLGGNFLGSFDNDFTTEIYGSTYKYNDIYFNFSDGSSFSIRNQIVSKCSHLGTPFYTFPTTFHNAYLPDGTKVSNPDEYNVKNAFKNYYKTQKI